MPENERFHIHYNRTLGKKYYSERDYRHDIQKAGLEPYRECSIKAPSLKKYQGVSDKAREMIASVTYDKKGKPNLGDRYYDELKRMGMKKTPKELMNKTQGGFGV